MYIKKNCFINVLQSVVSSSAVPAISESLLTPVPGSVFIGFFK